jgi:hypothetical protein
VVGLREDNWIDLGERKWGRIPSAPTLAAELESRMKLYSNVNNATLGRLIFTRRPVKAPKAEGPARFFSLDDLYSVG